jgi:hypothetical protein
MLERIEGNGVRRRLPLGRLKRALASRPSGEWNDDDFDVLADGVVVGRIMKAAAVPVGQSWMWTLAFGHHEHPRRRTATRRRARPRWRVREELAAGVRAFFWGTPEMRPIGEPIQRCPE